MVERKSASEKSLSSFLDSVSDKIVVILRFALLGDARLWTDFGGGGGGGGR